MARDPMLTSSSGASFGAENRVHLSARCAKADPAEGEHLHFSVLTTDPNKEVGRIHPKAIPVILTTDAEYEAWLTASMEEALKLQRPLPDGALQIVAKGERQDPKAEAA